MNIYLIGAAFILGCIVGAVLGAMLVSAAQLSECEGDKELWPPQP